MKYIIQMSEQDVRDALAKYFDTETENVHIHHKVRYLGEGLYAVADNYVEVEVEKKLEDQQ